MKKFLNLSLLQQVGEYEMQQQTQDWKKQTQLNSTSIFTKLSLLFSNLSLLQNNHQTQVAEYEIQQPKQQTQLGEIEDGVELSLLLQQESAGSPATDSSQV